MSILDKGTILTYTGKEFNLLWPNLDSICIEDIAHSLAMQCRFTGHSKEFYSVAQHSVYVSQLVPSVDVSNCAPSKVRLAALLHDAAEAYAGDIASPLKALLPNYSVIEDRIQESIYNKYIPEGVDTYSRYLIKTADLEALAAERDCLLPAGTEWGILRGVKRGAIDILPHFSPELAEEEFLAVFEELTRAIH